MRALVMLSCPLRPASMRRSERRLGLRSERRLGRRSGWWLERRSERRSERRLGRRSGRRSRRRPGRRPIRRATERCPGEKKTHWISSRHFRTSFSAFYAQGPLYGTKTYKISGGKGKTNCFFGIARGKSINTSICSGARPPWPLSSSPCTRAARSACRTTAISTAFCKTRLWRPRRRAARFCL